MELIWNLPHLETNPRLLYFLSDKYNHLLLFSFIDFQYLCYLSERKMMPQNNLSTIVWTKKDPEDSRENTSRLNDTLSYS